MAHVLGLSKSKTNSVVNVQPPGQRGHADSTSSTTLSETGQLLLFLKHPWQHRSLSSSWGHRRFGRVSGHVKVQSPRDTFLFHCFYFELYLLGWHWLACLLQLHSYRETQQRKRFIVHTQNPRVVTPKLGWESGGDSHLYVIYFEFLQ